MLLCLLVLLLLQTGVQQDGRGLLQPGTRSCWAGCRSSTRLPPPTKMTSAARGLPLIG